MKITVRRSIPRIILVLFFYGPSCSATYRQIPSEGLPFVYRVQQPQIFIPQFSQPIPWGQWGNPYMAFYSQPDGGKPALRSPVCRCDDEPPHLPVTPDSSYDNKGDEKVLRCAKLKGIYCEHNNKCYTRAIRGLNYFEARNLCNAYTSELGIMSTLLKVEDLTGEVIQNCLPLYSSPYDEEFWTHDDSIREDALKCPSLRIEFKRQILKVDLENCLTSDYAVCQLTLE